ncbi:MAG: redoxin domain-containing protein [Lachnospiraceae bacterium]|nr:redoxin domain-containing protein [Lachnospiraceae bacterium]
MRKYGKLVIGIIVLALLIGGSAFLYKGLAEKYRPDALTKVDKDEGGSGTGGQQDTDGSGTGGEQGAGDRSDGTGSRTDSSGAGSNDAVGGEKTDNSGEDNTAADDSAKAPDFTVVNEAEEEVKLSDFVGKPVVLNFWASWCGPCKSEMPFFQNMYDTYGEEVVFMMVNLTDGSRETIATALDYVQQADYTFPVYFDTNQEAAYAYYVSSIPATYFIDAEGNLVAYGVGALQEENILQGLNMLGIATE